MVGGSGGTTVAAAMSSLVTEVAKYGRNLPLTVQTDYAFGSDVGINCKYIQSLKKINSTTFEVVSWNFADSKYGGVDAGTNLPANKFRYTLDQEKSGPWKITKQILLDQQN